MPLALWGLSWIIGRSLKPLDEFKAELAQREPYELSEIRPDGYPLEILPTINEMNRLFERNFAVATRTKAIYCRRSA